MDVPEMDAICWYNLRCMARLLYCVYTYRWAGNPSAPNVLTGCEQIDCRSKLEEDHLVSAIVLAPTVLAAGSLAGDLFAASMF